MNNLYCYPCGMTISVEQNISYILVQRLYCLLVGDPQVFDENITFQNNILPNLTKFLCEFDLNTFVRRLAHW